MAESAALSLGGEHELLVDLLLRESLLEESALAAVRELQQKEECSLEMALYATRSVTDLDIARTYAKYLHVPLVELDATQLDLPDGLVELFPENFLRQHGRSLLATTRRSFVSSITSFARQLPTVRAISTSSRRPRRCRFDIGSTALCRHARRRRRACICR
jgi:hypothetical protein